MNTEDNREFVRMDVQIPFLYRVLSQEQASQINCPNFPDYSYFKDYIASELEDLDKILSHKVSELNKEYPQIAEVFRLLEQKVEVNRERLDAIIQNEEVPLRWINLSATGIGFFANVDLSTSDKVDILYRLDATMPIVILRCDVVKVVSTGGTRNRVSLQFQKISEKNKRDIVMFLQEKQIEKARRKKGD
jgi:hypothetical protein